MQFAYFINQEAEKYSFIMLPKLLMTNPAFKELSTDAKVLYACLLDRASLSYKNGWFDEQNRVYIYYPVTELMEQLNKSNKTVIGLLKELDEIGLIRRKRLGLGKPSIIYVMDFSTILEDFENEETEEKEVEAISNDEAITESAHPEVKDLHVQKCNSYTSRSVKSTLQEVKNLHSSNTNNNKTEINNTEYSFSKKKASDSKSEKMAYGTYKNVILSQADYQSLEKEISNLDELIERMSNYLQSENKSYNDYKAALKTWAMRDNKAVQVKHSALAGYKQMRDPRDIYTQRNYTQAFYDKLAKGNKHKYNYD